MERSISTPGRELCTRKEAADYLNIGPDAWDAIVERLGIPPLDFGPRTKRWPWEVVVGVKLLYPHMKSSKTNGEEAADGAEE